MNNDTAVLALAAQLDAAVQTEWSQTLAESADSGRRIVLVSAGLEKLYHGSRFCLQLKTVEGAWRAVGFTATAVEAAAYVTD